MTTKAGDFDGNGRADALRAYKVAGEWHLRVELDGGLSGDDLAVDVDPSTGLRAVEGFNVGDEAFAIVSSGASATSLGVFIFTNCKLIPVTANGRRTTFVVEATAERRTGLRCVAGTALEILNAEKEPAATRTFATSRVTFNLVDSNLVQAAISSPETYPADEPMLAPFGRFDCGKPLTQLTDGGRVGEN